MENINLIPALIEGYKASFSTANNVVGASEIPYGMRSIVITKRLGLTLAWKNNLLAGSMMHYALQKESVLQSIGTLVNEGLGYTTRKNNNKTYILLDNEDYELFTIEAEKERYIEILEGYFFRLHTDIHTTHWDIEIKTMGKPKGMWKDMAPYHIVQLNVNMGFNRNERGFLWLIDRGSTKEDERYASHGGFYNSASTTAKYLWNKYHLLDPNEFNQALFDFTLKKLKSVFTCLKLGTKEALIPCPEFVFECKDECSKTCPNPIKKVPMDDNDLCIHCNGVIEMGTTGIMRNNKMYHYTDVKGHPHKLCVRACLDAWEVLSDE